MNQKHLRFETVRPTPLLTAVGVGITYIPAVEGTQYSEVLFKTIAEEQCTDPSNEIWDISNIIIKP
jgi:hypothetical protein